MNLNPPSRLRITPRIVCPGDVRTQPSLAECLAHTHLAKYHGLKMGHRPGPLCSAPRGSKCVGIKVLMFVETNLKENNYIRMKDFFVGQNPSPQLPTPMYT
jgi:hypothetical protein